MIRESAMVVWLALLLPVAPALAQAVVSEVSPEDGGARVERLGSNESQDLAVGLELAPGDLLSNDQPDAVVALECPPGSNNSYNLAGPFRVLVSVPEETTCHVNMLSGEVDVLAEEPTTVTVGGVEMKSVGTQYAVSVWRRGAQPERKLVVYDGEVRARQGGQVRTVQRGKALAFQQQIALADTRRIQAAEIDRSAEVYSKVELAKAVRVTGGVDDQAAVQSKLKALHYDLLQRPDDQSKRVELAKEQMRYELNDRAVYQLKRADVVNTESFQRYQIDAESLKRGVSEQNRTYLQQRTLVIHAIPQGVVMQPSDTLATVTPPVEERTTGHDLRLIQAGRAREAVAGINYRFSQGSADSRDGYAMAKAYDALDDRGNAAGWALRALRLHERDGKLTGDQVAEMRRLQAAGGSG